MHDGTFIQDRDIFNISSIRRNPVIADLFARMNLMERRGSGLKKIIEAYQFEEKYNEKLIPEFRSTESAFFTVLKNLNYEQIDVGQSGTQNVGQNVGQKLTPKQRRNKIIEFINENASITAKHLANIFDITTRTVERDLAKLTEDGFIKYIGSSKDGKWVVIGKKS